MRKRNRFTKEAVALTLAASMMLGLAACGSTASSSSGTSDSTSSDAAAATEAGSAAEADDSTSDLVYAVEVGSAGEQAAEDNGFTYNSVASQADALMEVASGTSDAAIIDFLMAAAMTGEGTSYPDMVWTDSLTTEEIGAGCRKGSDLASYINEALAEFAADGTLAEIAATYNMTDSMIEEPDATFAASEEDSDVAYIQDKGTLIVGITDYAPMDYKDENDEWIGFDADLVRAIAEKLGVEVQFVEIEWDNKIMELNTKNIDLVCNGMTLTTEVLESMECTNAYCNNAQVVVVKSGN